MGSIYLYDLLYANLDPTIRLNNIAVKHLALYLSTQQSTHMSHVWLDQSLQVFNGFHKFSGHSNPRISSDTM